MIQPDATPLAFAIALACSAVSSAQGPEGPGYRGELREIEDRYQAANTYCTALDGNAADICAVTATGVERVAVAELEFRYSPSPQNRYEARIARTAASYAIAEERCDDAAPETLAACLEQASATQQAAQAEAEAEAQAQMMIADAVAAQ